jgi:hypothetical protein
MRSGGDHAKVEVLERTGALNPHAFCVGSNFFKAHFTYEDPSL